MAQVHAEMGQRQTDCHFRNINKEIHSRNILITYTLNLFIVMDYVIEYTEGPITTDSVWIQTTTTKHKLLIEDLNSGKQYFFRVAGGGSDPSRAWCDIVGCYVL